MPVQVSGTYCNSPTHTLTICFLWLQQPPAPSSPPLNCSTNFKRSLLYPQNFCTLYTPFCQLVPLQARRQIGRIGQNLVSKECLNMEGKNRGAFNSRSTPFQTKHTVEYGPVDPESHTITFILCKFCVTFSREGGPGQKGQKMETVKRFQPAFRPEKPDSIYSVITRKSGPV